MNTVAALAGFFFPIITGYLVDVTGNQNARLYFVLALLITGAFIALFMQGDARKKLPEILIPK